MSRYWRCPKCGKRCFSKNIEAHQNSDFCKFQVIYDRMIQEGWCILDGSWKRLIREGNVPTKREMVSLSGGRIYEQTAIYGLWIPNWADIVLTKTRAKSYPRTTRELRLMFLQHLAANETDQTAFIGAHRLTGWPGARQLLLSMVSEKLTQKKNPA